MSLTIGELVAYVDLEDKGFGAGLADAARDMSQLQSSTSSSMASVESAVTRAMNDVAGHLADGLDPTSAIADLDRLHASLDAALDQMLDEADDFDDTFNSIMSDAFDELDDDAQSSGRRAGDELVDGLRQGLRDAERVARQEGDEAGDGFGDGVEDAGQSRMSGVGQSLMSGLRTAGVGLAVAAGAAIGAAFISALESAIEKEGIQAKLNAQIGAYGKDSEKYGKIAGELYAQAYGDSFADVAEAVKSTVHNLGGIGPASKKNVGQISKDGIIAAEVLGTDVSEAIRAAGQLVKTGLAKNWTDAFDQIITVTQKGGDTAGDLLDTVTEYSTQFRAVGIEGPKAFGLLSQVVQAGGRDLDTAADAIKEFAIRSKDGSKSSADAFKALNLNSSEMFQTFAKGGPKADSAMKTVIDRIKEMEDPFKQNAVVTALFGTKAEDLQEALYALDPTQATKFLGDFAGATKKAGDEIQGAADKKLTAFKNSLQSNVVDFLGGTVLPGIEDFTARLQEDFTFLEVLARVQEFAAELKAVWDQVVADVHAWVEDNKTTIDDWGTKLEEGFASASEVVSTVLESLKELWAEYGDEIIVTVTLLVETFLNVWNAFWGLVSGIFKTVKGLLTGDMGELKEGLFEIWNALWGLLKGTVTAALKFITGLMGESWDDIQAKAKDAWQKMVAAITSKVSETIAAVQQLPGKLKTVFANAGTWLLQAGRDLIQGMINGVRGMATQLADSAKATVDGAVQAAKNALGISSPSKVFAEIGKWTVQGLIKGLEAENANVKSVVDKMAEDIKKAFKGRPDMVDHLLEFVKTGNKNLEDLALQRQAIVQKLADAKEYALKVAGSAKDFASLGNLKLEEGAGGSDIASGLKSKAQAIKDFAADIQALAKRGLNKATLQQIIDAGVEKGASFAEMLVGSDGSEIKAINKAQKQIDAASKKLGKTSADALYDVGKKAGDGYLKGLQESLKDLDKEMSKVAKALVAALKKELKIKSPSQVMAEIGEFTVAGLIQGIQAREGDAVDAMTGLIGKAISATAGTAGSVGKAASTTKIPINNATAIAGSNAGGVASEHEAGAASGTWGGGVNVTMNDTVIREEADIARVGAEFGFQYMARG